LRRDEKVTVTKYGWNAQSVMATQPAEAWMVRGHESTPYYLDLVAVTFSFSAGRAGKIREIA
jgi:hypothetical protein